MSAREPDARPVATTRLAEVAVPVPLRRTFTYAVPERLAGEVSVGSQVEVPFGRRTTPAFVVGLPEETDVPPAELREIARVTYPEPVFDEDGLALAGRVSRHYMGSLGEVLLTSLPGGLRTEARRKRPAREDPVLGTARVPERLSTAQARVVRALTAASRAKRHETHLLYGVTGSGKTEVYVRVAQAVVEAGGQVLLLVPEIGLSYQVVERFRLAFGERVGVVHSRMTRRARQDTWRAARTGGLDVVVGARSAVFTPLPALGFIVVDEENDPAYKQADSPHYNARDVAVLRAALSDVVVLLGSATPSLESFANALRGKYVRHDLPERIDSRPRPVVVADDLRESVEESGPAVIVGRTLARKMRERLDRREQIILFLNRRGYAPYVQCRACGEALECTACDVSLTYHRTKGVLVCHYCGLTRRGVSHCVSCGSTRIHFGGVGTERVEEEIEALLPDARVLRLDFDTTRRQGSHARILGAFALGKADVLLGTQMVAKGLDFPNVSLVGVINADGGLHLPDFRSTERTFQILTQVAGRAGRGDRPGEVVLQTYNPEHYAIRFARAQDYDGFFRREMEARRELRYPPYTRMANLRFDGASEERVIAGAEGTVDHLSTRPELADVRVLGPAPQPLSRLKGRYRWHVALRAERHARVRAACASALDRWEEMKERGVRLTIDVDPIDLL